VALVPSESGVYRALVRAGMIDPADRDRRSRKWKRWERGMPMELWQLDVVRGFPLADGTSAKVLTGIDDHSRICVCARVMAAERTRAVCDGLAAALNRYGAPEQILTARCSPAGFTTRRWRCCSTGSAARTASSTC
jgi:transposase InsO family protein